MARGWFILSMPGSCPGKQYSVVMTTWCIIVFTGKRHVKYVVLRGSYWRKDDCQSKKRYPCKSFGPSVYKLNAHPLINCIKHLHEEHSFLYNGMEKNYLWCKKQGFLLVDDIDSRVLYKEIRSLKEPHA